MSNTEIIQDFMDHPEGCLCPNNGGGDCDWCQLVDTARLAILLDGWVDLRENPENLPEHEHIVHVIQQSSLRSIPDLFYPSVGWYSKRSKTWREYQDGLMPRVVAWHEFNLPAIPDKFKITPEEINQHKDPMMGQI